MNKIKIFGILLLLINFTSCSKKETQEITNERIINYPNGKVETTLEELGLSYSDKHETNAINVDKDDLIERLNKLYSKTSTKGENMIGIVRHGATCGKARTLEIMMDCEDNANASWIHNSLGTGTWNGDISLDSKGNVTFNFCIVENRFNRMRDNDFAVLTVDAVWPEPGVKLYYHQFDNEDEKNFNYALLDGQNVSSLGTNNFDWYINKCNNCYNEHNMVLAFLYYPTKDVPPSEFPSYTDIGIDHYSVFATINTYPVAELQLDDEDNANANDAYYFDPTQSPPYINTYFINNIFNFPYQGSFSQFKITNVY